MIIQLIVAAALCKTPTLVGFKKTLTQVDTAAIEQAQKRCGEIFADSPCLTKIIKIGEGNYRAMCGAPGAK